MSRFIEINEHLIDMDDIKKVFFKKGNSDDVKFYITFKDNTTADLSTNRFWDNSYEHSKNNEDGYKRIKKYLLEEVNNE